MMAQTLMLQPAQKEGQGRLAFAELFPRVLPPLLAGAKRVNEPLRRESVKGAFPWRTVAAWAAGAPSKADPETSSGHRSRPRV